MPDGTVGHTGCDHDCLNRLSFIHCDPRTCPCGQYCSNKPFHLLKAPELDVFLTVNRGHGVRVNAPLPQGTFVMEYAGEVSDVAVVILPDSPFCIWLCVAHGLVVQLLMPSSASLPSPAAQAAATTANKSTYMQSTYTQVLLGHVCR